MHNAPGKTPDNSHYTSTHHAQKSHYPPGDHHVATSKIVLFPGGNHLLATGTDDSTL